MHKEILYVLCFRQVHRVFGGIWYFVKTMNCYGNIISYRYIYIVFIYIYLNFLENMSARRYNSHLAFWSSSASFILLLKRIKKKVWKTEEGQTDWLQRKAIVPSGETGRGLMKGTNKVFLGNTDGWKDGLINTGHPQSGALIDVTLTVFSIWF